MSAAPLAAAMETDTADDKTTTKDKDKDQKKEEEPSSYTLCAPCRVVPGQVKYVSFEPDSRWVPVKRDAQPVGKLVLKDLRPGEPVEYASKGAVGGDPVAPAAAAAAAPQEQEPPPPEPFGKCCVSLWNGTLPADCSMVICVWL